MRNENMFDYPELIKVREDMLLQDKLYQPTSFWHEASSKIVSELFQYGIENFRSLQTALGFFVPTYGSPGSAFSDMQSKNLCDFLSAEWPNEIKSQLALNKFLNGYFSALSDYRVLKASDDSDCLPYLHSFSESKVGNPIEQFEFDNRFFSRSSLNYLLGLSMLKKHLNGDIPRVVLEIGGGFGTLGEVLGNAGISNLHYIDIDIPPTSYIAEYYLGKIFGKNNVATYIQTANKNIIEINALPKISVLCSWQIEKIVGQIDLFVNFISFKEMEPHTVKNYLNHVMRLGARWILLRNMKEGKNIRNNDSVGVVTPILGDDYLSMLPGYELIERNVIPYGYQTVDNFNSELILLKLKE